MRRALLWALPVGYMVALFVASSVPGTEMPGHFWDKAEHFLAYAWLGMLFLIPVTDARLDRLNARAALKAVLFATLYGAFDEIHQAFTPDRFPDLHDLLADGLGGSLGVVVALLVAAVWKRVRRGERSSGEI